MKVAILDYGMGNIKSLSNALEFLGFKPIVIRTPREIKKSTMLFLPGVGSFNLAIRNLKKQNLFEELQNQILIKKKKILGICLGMQLFGSSSEENGLSDGLNFLKNKVTKFQFIKKNSNFRSPHVGFNNLSKISRDFILFKNLTLADNFYFIHKYKMKYEKYNDNFACCDYGGEFLAAIQKNNIFGVQFHPEKSQVSGLIVLKNFIKA